MKILIFGGTGSLGKTLVSKFIDEYDIFVFSRDEAKHVAIKQLYPQVRCLIGDVRDRDAVLDAVLKVKPRVIINAAALKNVPEVEEVPMEAVKTSILGTENINFAARQAANLPIKVLTVSTDKAVKPVNAYGMAKALQERLHIRSNGNGLICNAVRYGNVLQSRGSLIPILKERFKKDQVVSITHKDMTRFFLSLDDSVELIKTALADDSGGKIFVPKARSAKVTDVVSVLREHYGRAENKVQFTQIRPGEKIDEVLICREELPRTNEWEASSVWVVYDILAADRFDKLTEEVSSGSAQWMLKDTAAVKELLSRYGILDD